ncbi:hypothetical protein FPV67DRAFT_1663712 [Lyophyllum atratum]|nr:hypothetical protein FPV67DRAFT_1663712 [Lyophyllum atratum]
MDALDSNFTSYLDNGMDYLQPYPPSPAYGVSIGLPNQSDSPLSFASLNLPATVGDYTYASPPARPYTPADGASLSPPTLSYTLSAGELSSDGMPSGRHSRGSGSHSPPAIPYAATVPRSHRFNPIMAPTTRASDEEFQPTSLIGNGTDSRRETIRKQRIESEQRRRDELRDGYARLKETLPASNQKSSKVSLLDRATSHLRYLDTVREQLEARLKSAEQEVHRLRNVNEALMLGTARHTVPTVPTTF